MINPTLGELPETMLWNLYHRAAEAARADAVLSDPWAVRLVDRLQFPFAERFGPAYPLAAQAQALRALGFDRALARMLAVRPELTVIALGDGLDTRFWRIDNGRLRWLSVDLPEAIDLRRRLLPTDSRVRAFAGSALDDAWMDAVPGERPVALTAEGLLMYFEPARATALLRRCARRFPGATILFDVVPRWFSRRTVAGMRGPAGYQPPPMPWGIDRRQLAELANLSGVAALQSLRLPRGRGVALGALLPMMGPRRPWPLGYLAPWSILAARFALSQR